MRQFEEWIPKYKRANNFPPHPPEYRKPLYLLNYLGDELFFINYSENPIGIIVHESNLETTDDGTFHRQNKDIEFIDIKPSYGVHISTIDPFDDGMHVVEITIKDPDKNPARYETIYNKPFDELVLLWDTSETGLRVNKSNVD